MISLGLAPGPRRVILCWGCINKWPRSDTGDPRLHMTPVVLGLPLSPDLPVSLSECYDRSDIEPIFGPQDGP